MYKYFKIFNFNFLIKVNFFKFFNIIISSSLIISSVSTTKFLSFKEQTYSKEYNNLYNYIISNGGYINPKLVPNEVSKTNRFIITKEKIKKGEKILFIPDKVLISKIHKSVFKQCREAYGIGDEYEYDCLVYFMTIDKYNPSSSFKPYYDYLPSFNKFQKKKKSNSKE